MQFVGFAALSFGVLLMYTAWLGQPLSVVISNFVKGIKQERRPLNG